MITIDMQVGFILGGALAAATNLSQKQPMRDKILLKGLLLQCAVVTPLSLFPLLRFSDWDSQYLFNGAEFFHGGVNNTMGIAVLFAIVAIANISFYGGFVLVDKLMRQQKHSMAFTILGIAAFLMLAIPVALWDETTHLGTYAEFKAGSAPMLITNTGFIYYSSAAVLVIAVLYWALLKPILRKNP